MLPLAIGALLLGAGLGQAATAPANNDQVLNHARLCEPAVKPAFLPLPPGAVEPAGWLRDWAQAARAQALPCKPATRTASVTVRLVPYGCTKFRVSMFPVTDQAWAAPAKTPADYVDPNGVRAQHQLGEFPNRRSSFLDFSGLNEIATKKTNHET